MASVSQERAFHAAQLRYDDATPEDYGCFEDEPEDGPIMGTDDADPDPDERGPVPEDCDDEEDSQ